MNTPTPTERIRKARQAQALWAAVPLGKRCKTLQALRVEIAAQRARLVEIICAETGKPPLDALGGDILVTLEQMRFYESHAVRLLKRRAAGKPALLFSGASFIEQFEPHGVVLVFGPWNYPFQLAMVPAVTALFAGNAVILKCSERTPRVAAIIENLCRAANLPGDLLQVVDDAPENASAFIDAGPDMIFFTGSSHNGKAVAQQAAARLIPAVLELGGKDAAIVFSDCNVTRTVEGVAYGAFSNAGQVCVGIKRLYVQQDIYTKFIVLLSHRIAQLRVGNGNDCDLGVLYGENNKIRLAEQIHDARSKGAILHTSGEDFSGTSPILLSAVAADSRLLTEETFGPVLCIAPFQTEEEAIARANNSTFALSASVWTSDLKRARRVASAMNAGSCAINDVIRNIGNPHASFGGNGSSGYGRYHGAQGLYAFSRIKSVMETSGRNNRELNWFSFSRSTYKSLNSLLGFRHGKYNLLAVFRRLFLVLLCAALPALFAAQHRGHLHIRVTVPEGSHGEIAYLVFANKDGFPNDKAKALRSGFTPASGSFADIDVGELAPGHYAVSVYQDVNGNQKLDAGVLGIPKEPIGVSNNPKSRLGPPHFEDSAFELNDSDKTISIALVTVK